MEVYLGKMTNKGVISCENESELLTGLKYLVNIMKSMRKLCMITEEN